LSLALGEEAPQQLLPLVAAGTCDPLQPFKVRRVEEKQWMRAALQHVIKEGMPGYVNCLMAARVPVVFLHALEDLMHCCIMSSAYAVAARLQRCGHTQGSPPGVCCSRPRHGRPLPCAGGGSCAPQQRAAVLPHNAGAAARGAHGCSGGCWRRAELWRGASLAGGRFACCYGRGHGGGQLRVLGRGSPAGLAQSPARGCDQGASACVMPHAKGDC
jgi:hypothetical protein